MDKTSWHDQFAYNENTHVVHLSKTFLPLNVKLNGEVPSLDSWKDRKDWGKLTEPKTKEVPEESELLLFFDDCPNTKLNLFLFWKLLRKILTC